MAQTESSVKSWLIILLVLAVIFAKGVLAFVVVGDPGQPTWNYGAVADVPGESVYAVYGVLPHAQHVRGDKGE